MPLLITVIVIAAVVVVLGFIVVGMYNGLVQGRLHCKEAYPASTCSSSGARR